VSELRALGVDIQTIRELAGLYSHLSEAERNLTKIERVEPSRSQSIIEIRDSVINRSNVG